MSMGKGACRDGEPMSTHLEEKTQEGRVGMGAQVYQVGRSELQVQAGIQQTSIMESSLIRSPRLTTYIRFWPVFLHFKCFMLSRSYCVVCLFFFTELCRCSLYSETRWFACWSARPSSRTNHQQIMWLRFPVHRQWMSGTGFVLWVPNFTRFVLWRFWIGGPILQAGFCRLPLKRVCLMELEV